MCNSCEKVSKFSGHYLRNRSTLDIGVLGYIGIVQHKEHSPEILSIPRGTPCIVNDRWVSALLQQPETTSPVFSPTRLRSRTCSTIVQGGTEAAVNASHRRLAT